MNTIYRMGVWGRVVLMLLISIGSVAQESMVFQRMYRESLADDARDFEIVGDGYLTTGFTTSFSAVGDTDIFVQKLSKDGTQLWHKVIATAGNDMPYTIYKTQDGNFLLTGFSNGKGSGTRDLYLVKIDPSGNKLWDKAYGGSGSDEGREGIPTTDGGFIIVGLTSSYGAGQGDVWLLKVDASGNQQWMKTFGGSAHDYGYSVKQTKDGGYIVMGTTFSKGVNGDFWLIRTNSSGDSLWSRVYGGPQNEEGQYVIQDTDEGFVVVGDQQSFSSGDYDLNVRKFDVNGNQVWSKLFGGTQKDVGKMVQKTNDGGFILAGITRSYNLVEPNAWLIRLDKSGNKMWEKNYGGGDHEHCYAAKQTSDGGFFTCGRTNSIPSKGMDVYAIKTDANGNTAPMSVSAISGFAAREGIKVYPNPVQDVLHINVDKGWKGNCNVIISNALGQKVMESSFENIQQQGEVTILTNALQPGLYILALRDEENNLYTQKLTIR